MLTIEKSTLAPKSGVSFSNPVADRERKSFEIYAPRNNHEAVGVMVGHLMTKPNFSTLKFGELSRLLAGQVNRGHFFLIRRRAEREPCGLAGWALCSEADGEAWLNANRDVPVSGSMSGDCVLINMWQADDMAVNRVIQKELLRRYGHKKNVYARRFYESGEIRKMRLPLRHSPQQENPGVVG